MSTTPQPPVPPKWAMETATEIDQRFCNEPGYAAEILAIITRHHAAAQAETVALLVNYRSLLISEYEGRHGMIGSSGRTLKRIDAHLTQLKEGAP